MHSGQGTEYTAGSFRAACTRSGVIQPMGRVVGSGVDNAAQYRPALFPGSSTTPPARWVGPGGVVQACCPAGQEGATVAVTEAWGSAVELVRRFGQFATQGPGSCLAGLPEPS